MSRDVHWFFRDSVSHVACRLHFPTTGQHRRCHVCSKAGRAALGRLSGRQIWHNSASVQPVHLWQLVRYLVSKQCWSRSGQSLTEYVLIWQHPPRAFIPRCRIACVCAWMDSVLPRHVGALHLSFQVDLHSGEPAFVITVDASTWRIGGFCDARKSARLVY